MPPKQTLTADEEKKIRILNYFKSSNMVFSAATLETVAKAAKVSSMQIKNLVQKLADENLICYDKIGASTNYWQFSGTYQRQLQSKNETLTKQLKTLQKQCAEAEKQNAELQSNNSKNGDLTSLIDQLSELKAKFSKSFELEQIYLKNSPETYRLISEELIKILEYVNVETDNIFAVKRYLVGTLNMEKKQACQMLQITEDFDYCE